MIYKSRNLNGLKQVLNKIKNKTFNIETQYSFLKILKIIEPELDIYDNQMKMLLERYAEKDENGNFITCNNGIKIQTNKKEECQEKIEELNNLEISFHDIYFKLEDLAELGLTLDDLSYLEPFIKS